MCFFWSQDSRPGRPADQLLVQPAPRYCYQIDVGRPADRQTSRPADSQPADPPVGRRADRLVDRRVRGTLCFFSLVSADRPTGQPADHLAGRLHLVFLVIRLTGRPTDSTSRRTGRPSRSTSAKHIAFLIIQSAGRPTAGRSADWPANSKTYLVDSGKPIFAYKQPTSL